MKRLLPIFILLLGIAGMSAAAELTLDNVIDAHKAGVKPKILIQLIAAADSVSAVGPDEVARLRQEGVPEKVIAALKKRGRAQIAPKIDKNAPDDPRMEQLVALVRAASSSV